MKKWYTIFVIYLFSNSLVLAQSSSDQNAKRVDFGVGVVKDFGLGYAGVDYAAVDNFFFGINSGLHINGKIFTLYPTIRVSYYFNSLLNIKKDNFDLYGGLGASKIFTFHQGDNASSLAYFPVHAGMRYFFNEKFGLNTEIIVLNKIVDNNTLKLGITIKL